ncbi:MAG: hypothetical protein V4660_12620 [Pseudomonadota bacterium]
MKIVLTFTCMFFLNCLAHAADFDFKAETKLNYRYSESNRFGINFPFPPIALPVGETQAFLETPDTGSHAEISNIALFWDVEFENNWAIKTKVDIFDLYEKNPTSTDEDVSLDQFIIRYGIRHTQGELPRDNDAYLQVGKFSKFERQEDRHLESYGLSGTAFNRVEDSGIEAGVDFTSGIYTKLTYTTGNPVFIRDVNALAGDNGTDKTPPPNNNPDIKTGIPILYDAEIEDFDLSKNPETGVGLGYRWLNEEGSQRINLLLFAYERDLAETVKLHGTFYGGDLDILNLSEVIPGVTLPIKNNKKKESGMNIWWYTQNFSLFSQFVYQDIAGLKREGWEVELSYAFAIPDVIGMSRISPVFRYSKLNNDFVGETRFPSPSVWWDWQKYDLGFNTDFGENIRLTLEYNINKFVRSQRTEENNEFLATLRWRYD